MVLFNICPDLNFNYIGGNKRTKLKSILFRPPDYKELSMKAFNL